MVITAGIVITDTVPGIVGTALTVGALDTILTLIHSDQALILALAILMADGIVTTLGVADGIVGIMVGTVMVMEMAMETVIPTTTAHQHGVTTIATIRLTFTTITT